MSLRLYMDVHARSEITAGLRLRDIDVRTAQEDGTTEFSDSDLVDRATAIQRVLFSQDSDMLAEAAARQSSGVQFCGIIYAHQLGITIGQCIEDLELIAKVYEPHEMLNQLLYLPLR